MPFTANCTVYDEEANTDTNHHAGCMGLLVSGAHAHPYKHSQLPSSCFDHRMKASGTVVSFVEHHRGVSKGPYLTFDLAVRLFGADNCGVDKAGSRRDIPISIVADADTRHAMVVMSMDAVSQLGFKQLSIVTQKPLLGD